ncbi:hypothetical protein FBD94_12200 [Pedobacter hiemivivus]|uniref:Uncharacterized protein n=1 Tax=Pedobacter hiemivivus TaxID=2530454 RepID=A0A4R0N6S8_9SPHI|nr:hypothetical protein [Pedobacter hiemivivus]TCC95771.1 hypothetical protein EZ444_14225 [Pedobacter hiemivivus]TKC61296.1 hypothetical protein FBD94_12200 [Pedobacter hiemivivus]
MMNQEDIFKKVGQILIELQDQYEFLARNPSQLNELELELFLANANFLSDHVQIVRKINSNKAVKAIPAHTEDQSPVVAQVVVIKESEVAKEPEVAKAPEIAKEPELVKEPELPKEKTLEELEAEYAAANEEEIAEEPEPLKFEFLLNSEPLTEKFEFEEQSVSTIFDRPLSKEEEEIIAAKQRLRDGQLQQKPIEKIEPEKETPQIQEAAPRPTLNDILAGKSNFATSLNEENNKTTITDLKQAINLNQKLLYIKDLFNGYNLAYAEAIDLINKMPDFKTADNFLQQNYAVKNNWTSKQSTVDQFYELLNQRFPAK